MNCALLLTIAVLVLSGCVDRGDCLAAHEETYSVPQYMYIPQSNGTITMIYTGQIDQQSMVCDQWQYPEGKP